MPKVIAKRSSGKPKKPYGQLFKNPSERVLRQARTFRP
jgi:hypothetical protein